MASAPSRLPGERLVAIGSAVFGVGVVAALATVLPLLLGAAPMPTLVYLLAVVLCPLGLGLALAGLVHNARARRRPSRPGRPGRPRRARR